MPCSILVSKVRSTRGSQAESLTGYWKTPTATDTGLGLHVLDAPERVVDTTTGTGTCDEAPCGRITVANTTVDAAGHAGIPAGASAIMVAVNVIDPAGPGLVGIGAETGQSSGGFIFDTGQNTQASFITPLAEDGTINVNTWAATDLTIDVVGYFTAPTRTYHYTYNTTGLRASKSLDDEGVAGQGWTKEFTWDVSGGLPLLLAEHRGSQTSYLVYGPRGTPIYQVTATGDVMYFHQDHLGSTRLVTNANGTTKGTLTYSAYGKIKTNTIGWLQEQPLLGYNGQYHDTETGFLYLRARYLDSATGQFSTVDPLVALTEEPYGYVGGNPGNWSDPTGLWCPLGKNPNGSCRGSGVVHQAPGAATEVANTVSGLNALALAIAELRGGDCVRRGSGFECRGVGGAGGRAFTLGSVVFNPEEGEMDQELYDHESRHSREYAVLGWGFFPAYGLDWLGGRARKQGVKAVHPEADCDQEVFMWLERWAGLDDGGYSCTCPK